MSGTQREIVYCHECENEWYRDQHGLTCPSCHSDFTQIVEPGHDPREDAAQESAASNQYDAYPDPDEEYISDTRWQQGRGSSQETSFTYNSPGGAHDQNQHQQDRPMALPSTMGTLASMIGTILGGRAPPNLQHQGDDREGGSPHAASSPTGHSLSPPGWQAQETSPGTWVRQGGGPNFSWRITTTTSGSSGRSPPIAPGHGPQDPFMRMFMGSGPAQLQMHNDVFSRQYDPFAHPHDPFAHHQHHHHHHPRDPFAAGDAHGESPFLASMGQFGPLLASIFNPAMMRGGDAVYSQEALDRVISQLMEQNASGSAPGPAPAQAIASLPKRAVNEKDLGPEHTAECSICMDEVKLGDQVTELPCHHWFHEDCVKAWLNEHDTCPHCRQGIIPRDDAADSNRVRTPNEAPRHDQMWGQQGSTGGEGTRANPWVVPDADSPSSSRPSGRRRHSSAAGRSGPASGSRSARSSGGSSNEGLFSRMRSAFGGGSGHAS